MELAIGIIMAACPLVLMFAMLAIVVGIKDAIKIAAVVAVLAVVTWYGVEMIGRAIQ